MAREEKPVRVGDEVCGFTVQRVVALPFLESVFFELAHKKTGAHYIHIQNADPENTFAVAFKTVPQDSTGVAHILEHTALCGSARFPVRDPFFSMLKRSMNTFMNAFTASDWTMYPFCTQNRKDFSNLMAVYLDAAFFPLLTELGFKQEGIRVEYEDGPQGEHLEFKGVVYNEMKGAMSSPDQIMGRGLMKALYPDTTYGFNSGGDPEEIPSLSHQDLVAFHKRFYHPSNAYFYTWGSFPLEEHCAVLNDMVLSRFEPIDPKTDVLPQPRWDGPRTMEEPYPVAPEEDTLKKSQAVTAWLACGIEDSFTVMGLDLLCKILLHNAASPLRKALIDSGLGSSLADGTGYDSENRDTLFACGLKDIEKKDAPAVFSLVESTLASLVKKGIERELIDTAIHQYEFERKEITGAPYSYGLRLFLELCSSWLHHADPVGCLRFDEDMEKIRQKVEQGPFFESLIEKFLLNNPHRVYFTLFPDPGLAQRRAKHERDRLQAMEKDLTPRNRERIQKDAHALISLQESAEDLSSLPTMEIADIPRAIPSPAAEHEQRAQRVTAYAQPTHGIFYFTAAAKLSHLPSGLLELVPFFCYALPKMGTREKSYEAQAREIAAYTGGVGLASAAHTRFDADGSFLEMITLDAKCLARNQDKMFAIVRELMLAHSFHDLDRLKNLLLEFKAGMESRVVSSGHAFAISLCTRGFSRVRGMGELWHGVHQFRMLKELAKDLSKQKLADISARLSELGRGAFTKQNMELAVAGEEALLENGVAAASGLAGDLISQQGQNKSQAVEESVLFAPAGREAWTTSTSVSFVAHAFSTVRLGHPDAPVLAVCAKILRSCYLHREIREKGGAYGGFALSNAEDGLFVMASYRDPHIRRTMDVFSSAFDFMRQGGYSDTDIVEAILQMASDIDKPDSPAARARKAFSRKLLGLSDAARQDFKDRLLAVTKSQVQDAAQKYFHPASLLCPVSAVTSQALLDQETEELKDHPLDVFQI